MIGRCCCSVCAHVGQPGSNAIHEQIRIAKLRILMLYSSLYEWERFYKSTVEESRQLSKSTYGMAITDKDAESADGSHCSVDR
jgi:hypothetical protein